MNRQFNPAGPSDTDNFINALGGHNLVAGWNVLAREVPVEPRSPAVPHHWGYDVLREQLSLAAKLVPKEQAERRVLVLSNPGLDGRPATTPTIFADVQIVLPGEVTNIHRHTPSAIRFMLEGEGSFAMAQGERTDQVFGDLVLGQGWGWHSHGNTGNEPTIWFDALDIPLVKMLDASFFEGYKRESFEELRHDTSLRTYGNARMLPSWDRAGSNATPLLKYAWKDARPALMALPEESASPFDDLILEYVNPLNGGPCLPTMSCSLQRLRPGIRTRAHRHTSSAVYVAVEGVGRTLVGDKAFEWKAGDIIALPSWQMHAHENRSAKEDAILFSVTDMPVLKALGLYREQPADAQ